MIFTADGIAQFLEVNVASGMTETSLFPQAVLAGSQALPDLYSTIALRAAAQPRRRD